MCPLDKERKKKVNSISLIWLVCHESLNDNTHEAHSVVTRTAFPLQTGFSRAPIWTLLCGPSWSCNAGPISQIQNQGCIWINTRGWRLIMSSITRFVWREGCFTLTSNWPWTLCPKGWFTLLLGMMCFLKGIFLMLLWRWGALRFWLGKLERLGETVGFLIIINAS